MSSNISRLTYIVFRFKASFLQLFLGICEANREKFSSEHFWASPSFPSVISHFLLPISRPVFSSFFSSLLFQGYAQWPSSYSLRHPDTSPLSVFFLSSFRSLSFSALYLHLSTFNFLNLLLLFPHPISYQETEREAILNKTQCFLFPLRGSVSNKVHY